MSDPDVKVILSEGNLAQYYKELFASTDVAPGPEEAIDPQGSPAANAKAIQYKVVRLQRRLDRLVQIEAFWNSPEVKWIERNMLATVRDQESRQIWEALDKGDQSEIMRVRVEHAGILALFQAVNPVRALIHQTKQELAEIPKLQQIYVTGSDPLVTQ